MPRKPGLPSLVGCLLLVPIVSYAASPIVAVHASENTAVHWTNPYWKSFHPNRFLEESFITDGTPYVELSDAQITAGGLLSNGVPRYPILFSLATEAISDAEAAQILAFVQAGGTVYVGSSAWTKFQDGTPRSAGSGHPAFALGAAMGLVAGGWSTIASVRVQDGGVYVDHLTIGATYPWALTFAYNDQNGLQAAHRVYTARAAASPPDQQYLVAPGSTGFLPSMPSEELLPSGSWNNPQFQIRFANVDGDLGGRDDLVYRIDNVIYVRLSNGRGFDPATPWTTWSTAYDFQLADVNGDHRADLIGRSGTDIQVGLSTGTGFAPSTAWTSWRTSYNHLLADVNGDGKADLIGTSATENSTQVGLSTGQGFLPSTEWSAFVTGSDLQLADVDGDHRADLIARNDAIVSVRLSVPGANRFATAVPWESWGTGYSLTIADVDGDGKSDSIGRSAANDVQVGLSTGNGFEAPTTNWTPWSGLFTLNLADIDGDGKRDVVGCNCTSVASSYPPGDIETGLSTGLNPANGAPDQVALSRKTYGNGVFIYNAEVVPLAGYGGFANDNSEYKTIRAAIVESFQRNALPLVTLAPWPFPYRAAMIYRHDHWLAKDLHQVETAFASPGQTFGEYYVLPDQAGASTCGPSGNQTNDYPAEVPWAINNGALLGAHTIGHVAMDSFTYNEAKARLQATIDTIQSQTSGAMSPIFVAPAYFAIKRSSLLAIRDVGFLIAGEQGIGPFPHFSIDPDAANGYIGSVLQLGTTEWPGYDNMERLVVNPSTINQAARLAFDLGGLINVYDHAAGDPYGYGDPTVNPCTISRVSLAQGLLNYVHTLETPGATEIWHSNSLEIRNWSLQRQRHSIAPTITRTATTTQIDVSVTVTAPLATTSFAESVTGLRLTLDPAAQAQTRSHVYVTLDGTSAGATHTCADTTLVRCLGNELYVKIGASHSVSVLLAQ
jgi:hypothetical protein